MWPVKGGSQVLPALGALRKVGGEMWVLVIGSESTWAAGVADSGEGPWWRRAVFTAS